MLKFDDIRSYNDDEVSDALSSIARHPMMKALMSFTFPNMEEEIWLEKLKNTHTVKDFQHDFISFTIRQILDRSSDGITTSGFEDLDPHTPYLYISNHRDIVLDTSLLNLVLLDKGLIMTSSAIGDNLVQKTFLNVLAKLNRNFLVQRGLSLREQLKSSKIMSEYIEQLLQKENRSVWIAQREGRTKDGNDATQQGVLKMLAMAGENVPLTDYLKSLKIVPVSISYEYDPTDALKMPQLLAKERDEVYVKNKDEDFTNMMSGVLGQKKRIHVHAGKVLCDELDEIATKNENKNTQIQSVAKLIDQSIFENYKLWSTNYIAYDLLLNVNTFSGNYTEKEKDLFQRRLEMRLDQSDESSVRHFLAMYANPVVNQLKTIQKED